MNNFKITKWFLHKYADIPKQAFIVKIGKDNVHYTLDGKSVICRVLSFSFWDLPVVKAVYSLGLIPIFLASKGLVAFILNTDTTSTNAGDGYIRRDQATNNWGVAITLSLDNRATFTKRGLIKFTTPASLGTITDTKLFLQLTNANFGGGGSVELHQLTQTGYTEGTGNGTATADGGTWNTYNGATSWTTAGGDFGSVLATTSTTAGVGQYSWDLGTYTYNWGDTVYLLLKYSTEASDSNTGFDDFDSKQGTTKPFLQITYTPGSAVVHRLTSMGVGA